MDKYIAFLGCSFTWGQGLWNYYKSDSELIYTPTYSEYIHGNDWNDKRRNEFEASHIGLSRIQFRYPNLVASHFNITERSKPGNGGSNEQSLNVLEWVLNQDKYVRRTDLMGEVDYEWDLNKIKWVVFQGTQLYRSRFYFEYKGDTYYIVVTPNMETTEFCFKIKDLNQTTDDKWNPKPLQRYELATEEVSTDIFFDYIIESNISFDSFEREFAYQSLDRTQSILKQFEELGIKVCIWEWEQITVKHIVGNSRYKWLEDRLLKFDYKGRLYTCYDDIKFIGGNKEIYIRGDETANRYPEDDDEHPSKLGHELIADTIIKHIENNGGI